ncbi:hypothetical protein [Streptomyces sp. KR55]|uniref:hypothetical protein n=1 Tax=Streptomyces sp. KR55 TaxID=3457425 RepID=UPI003FD463D3
MRVIDMERRVAAARRRAAATIRRAWVELMKRLGYERFVAQGGDWGAIVVDLMALEAPPELAGIHTDMAAAVPPDIHTAVQRGDPLPSGLSPEEKRACEQLLFFYKHIGYAQMMGDRPQSMTGLVDSPVGLAAFTLDDDAASLELSCRVFDGRSEGLTRDDILDNITHFWLTKTGVSAARVYWRTSSRSSPSRVSPSRWP